MPSILEDHLLQHEVKVTLPCQACQPDAPVTGLQPGYVRFTTHQLGYEWRAGDPSNTIETSLTRRLQKTPGFKATYVTKIGNDHWFEIQEVHEQPRADAAPPAIAAKPAEQIAA